MQQARRTKPRAQRAITYRSLVLATINATDQYLTGQQLAAMTGLTYRQTIDALHALNNAAKVARIGRKFTARWSRVVIQDHAETPMGMAHAIFNNIIRQSRHEKDPT